MNTRQTEGLFKHIDFIVLDIICLQLCFVLAHWLVVKYENPYNLEYYQFQIAVLTLSQFGVIIFGYNYKNILRRGYFEEFKKVFIYTAAILIVAVLLLFLTHRSADVSRMQVGTTLALFVFIDYIIRILNKKRVLKQSTQGIKRTGSSLVVITKGSLVDEAMRKLTGEDEYMRHFVSGVIVTDGDMDSIQGEYDIPIEPLDDDAILRLKEQWVDEVLVLQSAGENIDQELLDILTDMGITVHFTVALLNDENWPSLVLSTIGDYKVLTSSPRNIYPEQMIAKRVMDIAGGIVGSGITMILFIFVAPAIYIKSPGPVFFKQDRVGKNGKVFQMYKFRSMYLDAEDRKTALMDQNKMDGLMFKMDDDPRIIGSEKKDRNGKPKGVGNFIRNTSIDEFPQFFNVLKGDMSLVGTRPPLLNEWEKYDIHHRARMTTKPGITGLWQISGRNEITDFEEVVKLDKQYIKNWSISEDIRILMKTIVVVAKRKGAE